MKPSLFKKIISLLCSTVVVISYITAPCFSNTVFADEAPEQEQAISTINGVADLHWVSGSTASLSWSQADEANYYSVKVNVYQSDGITLIGSQVTGTETTSIDVQQEIQRIVEGNNYESVIVTASVIAQFKQDGSVINESMEVSSDAWTYMFGSSELILLTTPTNLVLYDDYTL